MKEVNLKTRREFLKTTLIGGATSWTVPAFIQATIHSLFTQQVDAAVSPTTGKDGPVLVVIQLAGGNDGLNTLVPFQNDDYYRARPTIGIKSGNLLKLNDDVGIPSALTSMKELYDNGNLSIVQGVGYPNPNRSHFRSTEIWHTASDSDEVERLGWLGRYFDNQCRGDDASCGIGVGRETPQAFMNTTQKGITFGDMDNFGFMTGGRGREEDALFDRLNHMSGGMSGASISSFSGGRGKKLPGETAIDFLERTAMDAQVNSDRIRKIASSAGNDGNFPTTQIGQQLQLVSNLIAGGMSTRVYYASQGGYDTHTSQVGNHERLLKEYADSLKALVDDLKQQGNLDRVMVLTFSEFGRRVAENANAGTDHGAAAPMFIAGGKMKRGLIGEMPGLRLEDLNRGDLRHNIDFRSVYATLLEQHMRTPSKPVLGREFPLLKII